MATESVQLIFGGDGLTGQGSGHVGMLQELFSSALLPYHLGVPSSDVMLYVASYFLDLGRSTWKDQAENSQKDQTGKLIGKGAVIAKDVEDYRRYFVEIWLRARPGGPNIPGCDICVIMGHAIGTITPGRSYMNCGTEGAAPLPDYHGIKQHPKNLYFRDLAASPARILTIFDCCGNPQIACCLSQRHEHFNGKAVRNFRKNGHATTWGSINFPLVCSKQEPTRCIRIGYEGQNQNPISSYKKVKMSRQLLFPVTHCVLLAAKGFLNNEGNMNVLFQLQWANLHPGLLEGTPWDNQTHCSLDALQNVITNGDATLKLKIGRTGGCSFPWLGGGSSMDCVLYERELLWFLDLNLPLRLGSEDWERQLAVSVVDMVADSITKWHQEYYTDDFDFLEILESEQAWESLSVFLGPHRGLLFRKYSQGDDGKIVCDDKSGDWGLRELAVTSPVFSGVVARALGNPSAFDAFDGEEIASARDEEAVPTALDEEEILNKACRPNGKVMGAKKALEGGGAASKAHQGQTAKQ